MGPTVGDIIFIWLPLLFLLGAGIAIVLVVKRFSNEKHIRTQNENRPKDITTSIAAPQTATAFPQPESPPKQAAVSHINADLLNIVKQIVAYGGENILFEPDRFSASFADLARDIPKPQKYAFIKCLEKKYAQILNSVSEPNRGNCKQQLAQRLHEEEGLDLALCEKTLNLLEAVVLFGKREQEHQVSKLCKGCREKLQANWKVCPVCLAPVS